MAACNEEKQPTKNTFPETLKLFEFKDPGFYDFTVVDEPVFAKVTVVGGGGGGGGGHEVSKTDTILSTSGAGGGAGESVSIAYLALLKNRTYRIIVGSGGKGGEKGKDGEFGGYSALLLNNLIYADAEGGEGGSGASSTGIGTPRAGSGFPEGDRGKRGLTEDVPPDIAPLEGGLGGNNGSNYGKGGKGGNGSGFSNPYQLIQATNGISGGHGYVRIEYELMR